MQIYTANKKDAKKKYIHKENNPKKIIKKTQKRK